MKKTVSVIILCVTSGMLFCSCAEVPESLKTSENTEINTIGSDPRYTDYTQNAENKTETAERGNLDVIRSQLENDLSKKYPNIKIENARVGDGNNMPTYDVKIEGNPDFNFKNIVEYLYADKFDVNNDDFYRKRYKGDPVETEYPATFEPLNYAGDGIRPPNSYEFDIEDFTPDKNNSSQSIYSYSTGDVWGSEVGGFYNDIYYYEMYNISERYDLKYNNLEDSLSYPMMDGNEWNVKEAITFVENFWNNYLSQSDPVKYEYNVKTLFVIAIGNNKYGYLFEVERKDNNGNYYDVDCGFIQDDIAIESNNPFKIDNSQLTWITEKEVILRFSKDYSIKPEKQTNDGTNLLTLEGAADILSESLASNINLNIYSAELNYVTICKGYPYFQIWEYPFYYEYICLENCEFEIKPFWCFRTNKSTLMNLNNCEIYFIDVVTGELSVMKY